MGAGRHAQFRNLHKLADKLSQAVNLGLNKHKNKFYICTKISIFFQIFGPIGSAVSTFIGYKQTNRQTNRQAKFIYRLYTLKSNEEPHNPGGGWGHKGMSPQPVCNESSIRLKEII